VKEFVTPSFDFGSIGDTFLCQRWWEEDKGKGNNNGGYEGAAFGIVKGRVLIPVGRLQW